MYRRLISSLLVVALATSFVPTGEAAGPGGTLFPKPPGPPMRPKRTITVTTSTWTANLDMNTSDPNSPGVIGTVQYTVVTVNTTILGIPWSKTSSSVMGNVQRLPTVDDNLVDFVLYYGGVGTGHDVTSAAVTSNGSASFNLSSSKGDVVPTILAGDTIYVNAYQQSAFSTLKTGVFGGPVTTTTTYQF